MFMRNNFVILMFTLKVEEQSIPIWFKCDKTKSNRHNDIDELTKKWLFSERVIFKSIDDVIELLSPLNTKITFLGDRWFCNLKMMKHINDKGLFFCIRAKVNSNIRFVRDKNNKPIRILSLFNLGLTIFRKCYNSYIDYKIKCNMQLYL